MALRVLNQILEIPKLGKTPRAHLGPIWPDLAQIWPNNIDFGNPTGIVTNVWGVTFGGYLAKILSFKSSNLLHKSNFYLLSEGTVHLGHGNCPIYG